jgi:hypothetical protein
MTQAEVEAVADRAAKEALREVFLMLGADITNPADVQKVQADFRHVRRWREATDVVGQTGIKTAVKVLVTAGLGYVLVIFGWKAVGG